MAVDPGELRHWSRVALAAECAAIVQPLFVTAWPAANEKRRASVAAAIELATRSATDEQPCPGLKEAADDSGRTAGRAAIPHLYSVPVNDGEQSPAGPEEAAVASLSAKAAELAARAALDESKSEEGRKAFYSALDAARQAGRQDLVKQIWAAASERVIRNHPWWKFW